MQSLVLQPSSTSQWQNLVCEAAEAAKCPLDEELESYLVFLLMRFVDNAAMASRVMALDYMSGLLARGHIRRAKLRDVGDHCLLFSGLFPKMAEQRRVKVSYFVDLGRGAYHQLSDDSSGGLAVMFARLSRSFVRLMDVLQAMRSLDREGGTLTPLQAFELWQDTGSREALKSLRQRTGATPVAPRPGRRN